MKKSREEIMAFLTDVVGRNLNMAPGSVRSDEHLERYGIDSLQWADIAYELSMWIGRHVSAEDAASCETITGLATALAQP